MHSPHWLPNHTLIAAPPVVDPFTAASTTRVFRNAAHENASRPPWVRAQAPATGCHDGALRTEIHALDCRPILRRSPRQRAEVFPCADQRNVNVTAGNYLPGHTTLLDRL